MFTPSRIIRRILPRLVAVVVIIYLLVGYINSGAGKVKELKNGSDLALRIATGSPILVDFAASWCVPCKMMAPELDKVAAANKEIEIYKVDIDEHPNLAETYKVTTVPVVFFFNRGKQIGKFNGARDKNFIQDFMKESMETPSQ